MIRVESKGLAYYVFENLSNQPWLRHAVLTRHGPGGADWTLSLADSIEPAARAANLQAVESLLGAGPLALVGQVHGTEALVLERGELYAPKSASEMKNGYDAIIGGPGRSMMVRLADCQGVILADPQTRLVAVVHSGWRGSSANIAGKTVERLSALGARPSNLLAGVGPSLGPCCAEMVNYRSELSEDLWPFKTEKADHFDFWAATRHQLERAGVLSENIEIAGLCTKCHPDFYSYRRGDNGRFAVAAGAVQ